MADQTLFLEHEAWALTFGRHMQRIYQIEEKRVISPHDADQCALVGLWHATQTYEVSQGKFRTLAARRIKGELLDELRREKRVMSTADEECRSRPAPENMNPLTRAIQREQCRKLMRRVGRVRRARTIVRLTAAGYSQPEIAERLQITRRWVQVLLAKAREKAKQKPIRARRLH